MNEDGDPAQWIESVSEEQDACRKVARARRWSLNQTLAWVAFRRLEPVAQDDDEEGLLVWSGIREALGRPIGFEITGLDEAWRQLAAALAEGAFHGLGTVVSISRGGEVERHKPGQPLPPAAQAGLFMAYQLISDPPAVIASPEERKRKQWLEFRDLSFKREDIFREFPPDSEVIDAEFERLPPAPRQITSGALKSEADIPVTTEKSGGTLQNSGAAQIMRTGMAGRPSLSAELLQGELARRAALRQLKGTLAEEVEELLVWLKVSHPHSAIPKSGTAQNNLRKIYKDLKPTG